MKKFNLEKALKGEKVITRKGQNVFQLEKNSITENEVYILIGLIEKNTYYDRWTLEGKYWRQKDNVNRDSNFDLFMKETNFFKIFIDYISIKFFYKI